MITQNDLYNLAKKYGWLYAADEEAIKTADYCWYICSNHWPKGVITNLGPLKTNDYGRPIYGGYEHRGITDLDKLDKILEKKKLKEIALLKEYKKAMRKKMIEEL